ncbi:MAG: iron chelate uptake ABC transporter family permease subunit, partial [Acidobacteriota bacterium]
MAARAYTSNGALFVALTSMALFTLAYGQISLSLGETFAALTGSGSDTLARQIVLDIRLPRVVAAILAGGALGMAGVLM